MKIGILGGSFNPVHIGHIRMAIEVLERFDFDRVELVPAKQPPHKDGADILPFDLRLEMVNSAIADIPGLGSNPLENERPGPSFTCDTLTCYAADKPQADISFIVGASTFLEIPTWKRGMEIPLLTSLVIVNRWTAAESVARFILKQWPEAKQTDENNWLFPNGNTVSLITIPRLDIKAGHIRRRWLENRSLRFLVPPTVEHILEDKADIITECWGLRAAD